MVPAPATAANNPAILRELSDSSNTWRMKCLIASGKRAYTIPSNAIANAKAVRSSVISNRLTEIHRCH